MQPQVAVGGERSSHMPGDKWLGAFFSREECDWKLYVYAALSLHQQTCPGPRDAQSQHPSAEPDTH